MRKLLLSLPIVALMSVSSFAAGGPENAVSVDFGPTIEGAELDGAGFGVCYERDLSGNFSGELKFTYVGVDYSLLGYTLNITLIDPGIEFRYYFSSQALTGLFLGLGLEDYIVTGSISGVVGASWNIPAVDAAMGYKFVIGDPSGGFLIEPYIGYAVGFEQIEGVSIVGFEYGLKIGWAF